MLNNHQNEYDVFLLVTQAYSDKPSKCYRYLGGGVVSFRRSSMEEL